MSPEEAWNNYTEENTFLSWAKIVDCGDVRMTCLDNSVALKQLYRAHQVCCLGELFGERTKILDHLRTGNCDSREGSNSTYCGSWW
jgi:hypothetical protein